MSTHDTRQDAQQDAQHLETARAAVALWRGASASLAAVGYSANHVFSFDASGERFFLRLTSASHRAHAQIAAELDFILYLRSGGVSVSAPVESMRGSFIETVERAGETFFACVFTEAHGEAFLYGSPAENARHFRLRGQTLARIHALSKRYTPDANPRRHAWDEDELLRHTERFLPPSETIVWAEHAEIINWLRGRPRDAETFGLIHGDFGQTNYRVAGNVLTVFDFDDCCYHWFAYDLAIVIYPHGWRAEAHTLLDALLAGYTDEGGRISHSTGDLTRFCRLRQLYMFLHFARRWGFRNLSEQQADWFAQKRDNIARGYQLPPRVA